MSGRPVMLATLDGFAVEGGFDQPYGPTTCYSPASQLGQCSTPGAAAGLWENYESVLSHVASLGLDGIRLSVEWARIEPRRGQIDTAALERYRLVLRAAREMGLVCSVVAIDTVWPAWLGAEAWLMPWVAPRVLSYAQLIGDEFGAHADSLMLFARAEELVVSGYLRASGPPWRKGAAADANSAREQMALVTAQVAQLASWSQRTLARTREVPLVDSAAAMSALLSDASSASQIHLRSLVRGTGPTAAACGLLSGGATQWRVAVSDDVVATWR